MLRRRTFLTIVVTAMISPAVLARPKVWRIGVLSIGTPQEMTPYVDQLRLGLRDLGYVEDQNILLEVRFDEGRSEALPQLAKQLIDLKVDVLVAISTPAALAAKRATNTLPIVMCPPSDPVGVGLVQSLARPGGNVTGHTDAATDLAARRIQILQELVPYVKRIGVLGYPPDPVWSSTWPEARAAARHLMIDIAPVLIGTPDDLPDAFAGLNKRVQALLVAPQVVFWVHREKVITLAAGARLPASYELRQFVDEGGLVSYGPDHRALHRSAARYVDKILKGAKPGDLPVEPPTKFELVVNVKTAKTLGLTIPPSILASGHELVQ